MPNIVSLTGTGPLLWSSVAHPLAPTQRCPLPSQVPRSGSSTSASHVPSRPGSAQETQDESHAVAQQTLSTQNPD